MVFKMRSIFQLYMIQTPPVVRRCCLASLKYAYKGARRVPPFIDGWKSYRMAFLEKILEKH